MDSQEKRSRWMRFFEETLESKKRLDGRDGDVVAAMRYYQDSLSREVAAARDVLLEDFNNGGCASPFNALVDEELARARTQHPVPLNSHHEAYAVAREEVDECWDAVKIRDCGGEYLLGEIVQAAAMFRKWAEDLGLVKCG